MKKFILITAALMACSSPSAALPEPTIVPEPTPELTPEVMPVLSTSLNPQLCLDYSGDPTMVVDNEPFRLVDGAGLGQFSFTGTVLSLEQSAPFSGKPMTVVYLDTVDDGSEAHRYFYDKADGTIDGVQAQLLLKLGILEGGELSSSAYLNPETQTAILTALETGETLTLNMLAGVQLGRGMSAEAVNPCLIEL